MFLRLLGSVLVASFLAACGPQPEKKNYRTEQDRIVELEKSLANLSGQIDSLIKSDFADCGAALTDALIKKMCEVAQASTVEARVELKGMLASLANDINAKLDASQTDVNTIISQWQRVYGTEYPGTTPNTLPTIAECKTFTGNASIVGCSEVQASAIESLETFVSSINTTLNNTMQPIEIGTENLLAGPYYETLIRLSNKSRINAYSDGLGAPIAVNSNPLNATNGSATLAVNTSAAHGLTAGNKVRISGCSAGKGFLAQDLYGTYTVATAPTITTFTFVATKNATSSGIFGGADCIMQKYSGAGPSTIWESGDGSDTTVRMTSGSKAYNFAICENASQGFICYDTTNRLATFSTISAGFGATCAGSGNIVCK